jgi:hypothetical protein
MNQNILHFRCDKLRSGASEYVEVKGIEERGIR